MAAFSDYAESQLGAALLNGGTYTGGPVYVALFTSDPTDANSGAEVADSAYVRKQAHSAVVSDGFVEAPNGTFSNARIIDFEPIADARITVTHAAIFDAPTGGNMLLHAPLSLARTYEVTDIPRFAPGQLVFEFR
jgi:hypothetical protein